MKKLIIQLILMILLLYSISSMGQCDRLDDQIVKDTTKTVIVMIDKTKLSLIEAYHEVLSHVVNDRRELLEKMCNHDKEQIDMIIGSMKTLCWLLGHEPTMDKNMTILVNELMKEGITLEIIISKAKEDNGINSKPHLN